MREVARKIGIFVAVAILSTTSLFVVLADQEKIDSPMFAVEKMVWNEEKKEWVDYLDIKAEEGDDVTLRFNCTIKFRYTPPSVPEEYNLSLIAFDYLPNNLKYVEGSSNYPAVYWENNNTIYWPNLLQIQSSSGSVNITFNIYFNATVLDEGKAINNFTAIAYLWCDESSSTYKELQIEPSTHSIYIKRSDTVEISIVYVNYYKLNVEVDPEGAGSVVLNPAGGTYEEGTVVELTAVASDGYVFDHWGGNLSGSDNPTTIVMDSNKSVVAYFIESITPPSINVSIVKPIPKSLYLNDQKVFFTPRRSVIIGPITIEANVSADEPISEVDFYIAKAGSEEVLKYRDYSAPYKYMLDERAFGLYTIIVKAYDIYDNSAEDNISVFMLNFHRSVGNVTIVSGMVFDYNKLINGKIGGAIVTAYRQNDSELIKVDSDRTGRFLFNKGRYRLRLESGYNYYIEVSAKGYETVGRYISIANNETTRIENFYLNGTILVKGKVMKSGLLGRGIRGANITVVGEGGKIYNTTSGLFGKYSIYLLPGNYTIFVHADGYNDTFKDITVKYKLIGKSIKVNFKLEATEEAS